MVAKNVTGSGELRLTATQVRWLQATGVSWTAIHRIR